jgi:hypothetical protein
VIYHFRAEVWLHAGDSGWHFLTLPTDVADEIDLLTEGERRGFGSVRVEVTIGSSTWRTSIFPDTSAESYVLPVKKPVRTAQGIEDGDPVDVVLELVDRPSAIA